MTVTDRKFHGKKVKVYFCGFLLSKIYYLQVVLRLMNFEA